MNSRRRNIAICILVLGLSISGCGPGQLFGPTRFVSISGGFTHACALTSTGGVKCWGHNIAGQLGDDTTMNSDTPVNVIMLPDKVRSVSAGWDYSCAVTSTGGVKCWGKYDGDGTMTQNLVPVDVSRLASGVSAIVAGTAHTCVLTSGGGVKCWGGNQFGELGDGTTTAQLAPVDVRGLANGVRAIAVGNAHTCVVTSGGGVKCWGHNNWGQLGDGTTIDRLIPVDVRGLTHGVIAIAAGYSHTCALTVGGGVKCWGDNGSGELGDGTTTKRLTPVDVSGLATDVRAIASGSLHMCALIADGRVKCWGDNSYHHLGDGTRTPRLTPVEASEMPGGVTAITAGKGYTCVLTSGGGIKCLGFLNYDGLDENTRLPAWLASIGVQP